MDFGLIAEWTIKSLILILSLTGGFAYTTWVERRVLARMQVRIGPNRVGWQGLLQPVADGLKLIFKEELVPANADKIIYLVAPVITAIPALVVLGVIPWGTSTTLFGLLSTPVSLQVADINVGILYILSITSISVYGITLAGWSSNNKYATLGGLRATSQMMSYELSLGLSYLGIVLITGSMAIGDIITHQSSIPHIVWQPIAFFIYVITSIAEVNRAPFDMPEAEQELTAGYHTEYSSMTFALFFMAEYIKMIAISMIGVTIFLGGYQGPFVDQIPELGPVYLFIKTFVWLFVIIWLRATLPRIRYDRLMTLEWKVIFPIALANVLVTALVLAVFGG